MPKVMCTALNSDKGPHFAILEAQGFEVCTPPPGSNLFDSTTLISVLKDVEAVVAGSEPYTREVLQALPKLRVLARTGVGYDAIDVKTCDERRVVIATTPGVNHHSVAEHTIALLMGVARGFPELDRRVRESRWKRIAYPQVIGTTMGIVGLGRIGRAVATRAVGLGMKVVASDPYPHVEFAEQWGVEILPFEELVPRVDYLSLHMPMSVDSHHLMNAKTFSQMKRGSVLINTARGALVDEAALYEVLKSGHLRAAALDVFEVEPLPATSPLLELPNVLLSGHVAGLSEESQRDTLIMTAETIIALSRGERRDLCVRNLQGVTDWCW